MIRTSALYKNVFAFLLAVNNRHVVAHLYNARDLLDSNSDDDDNVSVFFKYTKCANETDTRTLLSLLLSSSMCRS